jgi:hypothetical protein
VTGIACDGVSELLPDRRLPRRSSHLISFGIIPAATTIVTSRSTCSVTTIGPECTSLAMASTP